MEKLKEILTESFNDNSIIKIVLSNKRKKSLEIKKVDIRPGFQHLHL